MWSTYSNCFTFERYTSGDISSISHKSRPSIPSLSPTVVNYTLEPCLLGRDATPLHVMLYFVAPSKHVDRSTLCALYVCFSIKLCYHRHVLAFRSDLRDVLTRCRL